MKKALIMSLCAVLLVTATVLGTLAFLTAQDTVVNTFTVGQVSIELDEAKVKPDGTLDGDERVKTNDYHLVPGMTYIKDPTMTVEAKSEEAYVRMLLVINCASQFDEIFSPEKADLTKIFNGYDAETWVYVSTSRDTVKNTVTYEFRYKETVATSDQDTVLPALFKSLTVPGNFDGEDMAALADLEITVIGNAIQAASFDNADDAWTAFNDQINK